eukprot:286741-Prymnesium_polylepis.1
MRNTRPTQSSGTRAPGPAGIVRTNKNRLFRRERSTNVGGSIKDKKLADADMTKTNSSGAVGEDDDEQTADTAVAWR